MADPFRDVSRGQPLELTAPQINGWNLAGRLANAQRNAQNVDRGLDDGRRPEVVRIKNMTGAATSPGAVLTLGDPAVLPTVNETTFMTKINFQGTTPASGVDLFAIMLDPMTVEGMGLGLVAGAAYAKINVSDVNHKYAIPYAGDNTMLLSSDTGSCRILWKESGTGVVRAYVLICQCELVSA